MSRRFHGNSGPSQRQLRVAELLRRNLAEVLSEGVLGDPDLPRVSITVGEVRMSPDLRKATVFVLPLGGDHAEEIVTALNRERSLIRRQLNRTVHLKHSPELRFVRDRLFDEADAMRRLFDREEVKRDLAKPAELREG